MGEEVGRSRGLSPASDTTLTVPELPAGAACRERVVPYLGLALRVGRMRGAGVGQGSVRRAPGDAAIPGLVCLGLAAGVEVAVTGGEIGQGAVRGEAAPPPDAGGALRQGGDGELEVGRIVGQSEVLERWRCQLGPRARRSRRNEGALPGWHRVPAQGKWATGLDAARRRAMKNWV